MLRSTTTILLSDPYSERVYRAIPVAYLPSPQSGLFFRNRVVGRSRAAGPGDHQRDVLPSKHSVPYPDRRPRPWNSKNVLSWSASGGVAGGTGGFVGYGGTRGRASGAFIENNEGASLADRQEASSNGDYRGGGGAVVAGSTAPYHHPHHPRYLSRFRIEYPVPALRSARLRGWRRGQSDEGDVPRAGSAAAGLREEDPLSVWDHGVSSYHHQSISRRQDHERGKGFYLGAEENGTEGGTTAGVASSPAGGDGSGGCKDGKSGGYPRGGAGRVLVSKTEPWAFDLSHSPGEEERRGRLAQQGSQRHTSWEGGRRQQRRAGGGVDERWMRLQGVQQSDRGGGGRVFFPWREEILSSASGKRASSTSLRSVFVNASFTCSFRSNGYKPNRAIAQEIGRASSRLSLCALGVGLSVSGWPLNYCCFRIKRENPR